MARGDHLYVERLGGLYSHHGIDCGDGTVIHYWPDGVLLRSSVKRTTLREFAEGGSVRVRSYDECDPPETVIGRAVGSLGARGFDPLTSNCEHFAVWCKTGRVESHQFRSTASYVHDRPGAAAAVLMFSPVVAPVLVLAVLVWNVLDSLDGSAQKRRWQ
jgi:lecithin:retinol acyltransferase